MIIRYYLQTADRNGFTDHPLKVMEQLGLQVITGIPETIADLWFFEIPDGSNVPSWIDVMDEQAIKALPEWINNKI